MGIRSQIKQTQQLIHKIESMLKKQTTISDWIHEVEHRSI